jgi:large subunit ribosomal protein L25
LRPAGFNFYRLPIIQNIVIISGLIDQPPLTTVMSSITQNVGALPNRLRNFFARYPPQIYSSLVAPRPTPPESEASADQTLPSPYTPDRDAKGAHRQDPEAFSPSRALLYNDPKNQNPFLPRKIFNSKKWIGPRYGLRQQADLVKLAVKYNVEPLLPPGPKSTEYKAAKLAERGLRIKGTGIGQKVKGHKWERTMEARLEDRRKAMVEMPEMIRLWKQVSIFQNMLVTGTELTLSCREVMVAAGDSGRSGKWDASCENIALFLSIISHWSTLAISVRAIARSIPSRVQSPRQKHLVESLRGFGMGVLFDLRYFFSTIVQYTAWAFRPMILGRLGSSHLATVCI